MLAINGLVFLLRSVINLLKPTSFYLEPEAPGYARDAVRVLGVTYGVLGMTQLGVSRSDDSNSIRTVSVASMLFALGAAVASVAQNKDSKTAFRRMRLASATENLGVVALYAVILKKSRQRWP